MKKTNKNPDKISILNYQGSKSNLLEFIHKNVFDLLEKDKAILDMFSGSGSVGYSFKRHSMVYGNDSELYSSIIAKALLCYQNGPIWSEQKELFWRTYNDHLAHVGQIGVSKYIAESSKKTIFLGTLQQLKEQEEELIKNNKVEDLNVFYDGYPKIYENKLQLDIFSEDVIDTALLREKKSTLHGNILFSTYYVGTYFGLQHAMEIDSIRYAIEKMDDEGLKNVLLTCLFYAMKECVFSKDGHMAQPLDLKNEKNHKKLLKIRKKCIKTCFELKLQEFHSDTFCVSNMGNKIFNHKIEELLKVEEIVSKVGVIYADPPYTDMQYSRYYHLLNTVALYDYPDISLYRGKISKGLYRKNRFQSPYSQRGQARAQLQTLMNFAKQHNIKLVLSFAFPQDPKTQATNRYTISIDDLIDMAHQTFGEKHCLVVQENYKHSNNRKKETKKVWEYLIIFKGFLPEGVDKNIRDKKAKEMREGLVKLESNQDREQEKFDVIKQLIRQTIPSNKSVLYKSHLYWSQKPYNIADILIENLSQEGDVIFDPFMGSGVTLLQSLKKDVQRKAVGVEINDVPIFIVQTLLEQHNISHVKKRIDEFLVYIERFTSLYETNCMKCGSVATITKTIFDRAKRDHFYEKACLYYDCSCGKNQNKKEELLDRGKIFFSYELQHMEDMLLIENSKIAVGKNQRISSIFTSRNIKILDQIVKYINTCKGNDKNVLQYILLSILHLSKITDTHSNSQWPLYTPKRDCVEKNIVKLLKKRSKLFMDSIEYANQNFHEKRKRNKKFSKLSIGEYMILKKGIQKVPNKDIPDNSVDLVITDPPYLDQVLYSEYMQLYQPFLNLKINLEDEIVVSSAPKRRKNSNDYFSLLQLGLRNISRVLKKNSYMCMYFHDNKLDTWKRLIEILEDEGFQFLTQVHIKKSQTVKNNLSPRASLSGDAILFFKKVGHPDVEPMKKKIIENIRNVMKERGGLSTPEIYDDVVMEMVIKNKWLKVLSRNYTTLIDMLEDHFEWNADNCKWYVKEENQQFFSYDI